MAPGHAPSSSMLLVAVLALGGCASREVASLTFALGAESLPDGTEAVSVVVVHWNELGPQCLSPVVTMPGGGAVSSSAELVCAVDADCADLADGYVIEPIPVFTAEQMANEEGVTVEEVPPGFTLVFLEAYDADENAVGAGCGSTLVDADETSLVAITISAR